MSRDVCNTRQGGENVFHETMLGMEEMQMKGIEELIQRLTYGEELRGADALAVLETVEINPWYPWVSMALLCLHYGDAKTAKIILDGLLCDEEL